MAWRMRWLGSRRPSTSGHPGITRNGRSLASYPDRAGNGTVAMLLKTWYFITISLAALLMGTTFCHVLEMPPKMHYPAALYLTLHRTLYRTFGTFPGPFIEIGSILAAAVLSLFVRDHRPAFYLSLLAAVCLVAAFFGVWVAVIAPVNAE